MKLDEPPTTLPFQKSKPEREVGTPCHWPSLPRSSMTCCSSLSFGVYTLRRQQASSSLKKSFSLSHGPFSSTSTDRPAWARRRDRKSVVTGKRVSVRVDLGGRRIIKKQKKHK